MGGGIRLRRADGARADLRRRPGDVRGGRRAAGRLGGRASTSSRTSSGDDWEEQRQALLTRELSLAELLAGRGLALRSDLLRPFAHWITPPVEPRRYDTKFFAAALPIGQEARHVSGEADEAEWLTPSGALREVSAGVRPMMPPTIHTLGQLDRFSDVASALAGSPPDPMEPISPTFEETADGKWAVLPDGTRIRLVVPLPS